MFCIVADYCSFSARSVPLLCRRCRSTSADFCCYRLPLRQVCQCPFARAYLSDKFSPGHTGNFAILRRKSYPLNAVCPSLAFFGLVLFRWLPTSSYSIPVRFPFRHNTIQHGGVGRVEIVPFPLRRTDFPINHCRCCIAHFDVVNATVLCAPVALRCCLAGALQLLPVRYILCRANRTPWLPCHVMPHQNGSSGKPSSAAAPFAGSLACLPLTACRLRVTW